MKKYLFQIYRILIPKHIRAEIQKRTLKKKIFSYFANIPPENINEEQQRVLNYLKKNPVSPYPYYFAHNYSSEKVEVFYDNKNRMRYVMLGDKRLYYKRRYSIKRIKRGHSDLMREQDIKSPHLYLTDSFFVGNQDVIADIGAAEGNFALSVVDKAKKIYLFEYDKEWCEALKITFSPWKEKVEIINKKVDSFDDPKHIKIDTLYAERKDINFLKIDVDGSEKQVLNSCKKTLETEGPIKIALCTYHKNNDEIEFTELLKRNGFRISLSDGYMIPVTDKNMKAPYLRKGLIRAVK
jgi:hypothetical protein